MDLDPTLPTLDREVLAELERAGRSISQPDLVAEVFETFRQGGLPLLSGIDAGIRQADPLAVFTCAHKLKSSSGAVGAARLVALCDALQRLGKRGVLEGAAELYAAIQTEYAAVLAASRRLTGDGT